MYKAKVYITLKEGVLDPEGQAVCAGLHSLGFTGVALVRMNKSVEIMVEAASLDDARALVCEMCERLLANPIMEEYHFVLDDLV